MTQQNRKSSLLMINAPVFFERVKNPKIYSTLDSGICKLHVDPLFCLATHSLTCTVTCTGSLRCFVLESISLLESITIKPVNKQPEHTPVYSSGLDLPFFHTHKAKPYHGNQEDDRRYMVSQTLIIIWRRHSRSRGKLRAALEISFEGFLSIVA